MFTPINTSKDKQNFEKQVSERLCESKTKRRIKEILQDVIRLRAVSSREAISYLKDVARQILYEYKNCKKT